MSLFEIGRLAVKIAGRDAGKTAIVVDQIDDVYVLIDGDVRRKKCNIKHLEPLTQVIKINKGASHQEVEAEFKKIGLEVRNTNPKEKTERPVKQRKEKLKVKKQEVKKVEAKPVEKKDEPKVTKSPKNSFEAKVEEATTSPEETQ